MLLYLAAQYRRRAELCHYREVLEALGHPVTARWLHGTHEVEDPIIDPLAYEAAMIRFAQEDMTDIARAQLVIAFTEPPRSPASRGGRHAEAGMALAWNKMLWICGPRENVFYHLPQVRQFDIWAQCLAALTQKG